ncbi:hypothetical protein M2322_004864 [Rhodoblastus acidophilus]|uniref:hypothetical protein n=1 Tax=Rhodoblastus acidophilus TaxID=1074 RepID=UPI0022243A83|nr:hypothetical protein [Rhodoblastus acidophilus]MCW2319295.1 hypothetical protein [Rhodoblastus acidophilus]
MTRLDAEWLAERMANVIATPSNPYTVLTSGVDDKRMQEYVSALLGAFADARDCAGQVANPDSEKTAAFCAASL